MPFREIRGQNRAMAHLQRSVASGQIPHALLFSGPEGVGKKTAALALAQALNCQSPDLTGGDACGTCAACRKTIGTGHPDVRVITPDGNNLKIDQVREQLQRDVQFKPMEGKYKVYILDPAESLTPEAANSLLKILEEPPAAVVIILITAQPFALLDTIRSRCQELRFAPVEAGTLSDWIQARLDCAPEQARMLARLSEGRPAEALRMADPDFLELRSKALDLAGRLEPGNWPQTAAEMMEWRAELPEVLTLWLTWFRDLAVLAGGGRAEQVINQDRLRDLQARLPAHSEGRERLLARCRMLLRAFSQLKRNVNGQLLSEVLLMQLAS